MAKGTHRRYRRGHQERGSLPSQKEQETERMPQEREQRFLLDNELRPGGFFVEQIDIHRGQLPQIYIAGVGQDGLVILHGGIVVPAHEEPMTVFVAQLDPEIGTVFYRDFHPSPFELRYKDGKYMTKGGDNTVSIEDGIIRRSFLAQRAIVSTRIMPKVFSTLSSEMYPFLSQEFDKDMNVPKGFSLAKMGITVRMDPLDS